MQTEVLKIAEFDKVMFKRFLLAVALCLCSIQAFAEGISVSKLGDRYVITLTETGTAATDDANFSTAATLFNASNNRSHFSSSRFNGWIWWKGYG